jgi:hypothetical protein
LIETIFGGLLGGLLRLAPEVMTILDKKDERKHELAMFDKQLEADKQKGEQALAEGAQAQDTARIAGGLSALVEGIKGQSQLTGVKWIDGITQSVRPFVTYWLLLLYIGAKASTMWVLYHSGGTIPQVLQNAYGPEDMSMLAGVLNFWFLSRVFEKSNGK